MDDDTIEDNHSDQEIQATTTLLSCGQIHMYTTLHVHIQRDEGNKIENRGR